jgi:DNA-binding transcriptional MerR regulator
MEPKAMNLVTTAGAAKILPLPPDAVRYHERQGHIVAMRVERGQGGQFQRLFVQEDLERFGRQRAAAALARQSQGDVEAEVVVVP